MGDFSMGLAEFISKQSKIDESEVLNDDVDKSKNLEDRIHRQIEAKIAKLKLSQGNQDNKVVDKPNKQVHEYDFSLLEDCFGSMSSKDKVACLSFYNAIKDNLDDDIIACIDKIVGDFSELEESNVDDITRQIESNLIGKGFNVKVRRHKIKHVTPCIRVDFTFDLTKDFSLEPIQDVLVEYDYKYQSRRRNSAYFVN